jgi:hypothetical protein
VSDQPDPMIVDHPLSDTEPVDQGSSPRNYLPPHRRNKTGRQETTPPVLPMTETSADPVAFSSLGARNHRMHHEPQRVASPPIITVHSTEKSANRSPRSIPPAGMKDEPINAELFSDKFMRESYDGSVTNHIPSNGGSDDGSSSDDPGNNDKLPDRSLLNGKRAMSENPAFSRERSYVPLSEEVTTTSIRQMYHNKIRAICVFYVGQHMELPSGMKHLKPALPEKYDGADDVDDFIDWVIQICRHFLITGLSGKRNDNLRKLCTATLLGKRPRKWYDNKVARIGLSGQVAIKFHDGLICLFDRYI